MNSYFFQKTWKYIRPVFRLIPNKAIELLALIFIKLQKRELMGKDLPKRIVFFATSRCNLKCKHCFYIPNVSPAQEMTLVEIQRMVSSAKNRLKQIIITGGEPFLRNDIYEIALSFVNNGCRRINIATNGTLLPKIESFLEKILKETQVTLVFHLSLDGPIAVHDNIRGVPGSAEKTLKTLTVLSEYYRKYPNRFGIITVGTSINKMNSSYLEETIDLVKNFENITHTFNFTRSGDIHTFGAQNSLLSGFDVQKKDNILDIDEMKNIFRYLDKNIWQKKRNSLFTLANRQVLKEVIKLLEKKNKNLPCLAGRTEIVVYPEGNVGICEMLKPVGNLKETNYDLVKFYEKYKDKFQSPKKCSCSHDCNIMSSIRFSPESLTEMINLL